MSSSPHCLPEQRHLFHWQSVLSSMPRLLSALNRCPVSASSGSFDREYWAWCTKDFANQDLQRAVLLLAWLFSKPHRDNAVYGEKTLLIWLEQAIDFWIRGQDGGGGFDHLYPFEKSWMAAAFTLVDMASTWDLVAEKLDPELRRRWLGCMLRAGLCLVERDEDHGFISNHRAGAAAGLLALARLSGKELFAVRAKDLLSGIFSRQSSEGFFREYEGADPGYETLGLHYLAKAQNELEKAGESETADRLEEAACRSIDFLSHFVHPDGSLGGEYGSRGCPQVFPGGLEFWARRNPAAEAICRHTTPALASNRAAGLSDSDIRNEIPLLSSSIWALQSLELPCPHRPEPAELPCTRAFERAWPLAGLYVRSEPGRSYLVFGASKGGVVKIYNRDGLVHSDCGYTAHAVRSGDVSTHLWQAPALFTYGDLIPGSRQPLRPEAQVCARVEFMSFKRRREMNPWSLTAFRLFNLTLGRRQLLNGMVRKFIIHFFLTGKKRTGAVLERRLFCTSEAIEVRDRLLSDARDDLSHIAHHGFFATVYMASARYFRLGDFRQAWTRDVAAQSGSGDLDTMKIPILPD